jgi:malate synthase
MEDLATDRIYRLMLAQRVLHRDTVPVVDGSGRSVRHTPEYLARIYDEELELLLRRCSSAEDRTRYRQARLESEAMIVTGRHDPV